jgi:Fe-S cluster biogenesis protein NfuA
MSFEENVRATLDTIRPRLQADGGDMEFVKADEGDGKVFVRLMGHCCGCPMATMTLKMGVEAELKQVIPTVTEVVEVP